MWRWPALAGALAFSVSLALFFATIGCVASATSATVIQAQQKRFLAIVLLMMMGSFLLVGPFVLARQMESPSELLVLAIQSVVQTLRGWTPAMPFFAAAAALMLMSLEAFGVGLRSVRSQRSQPG